MINKKEKLVEILSELETSWDLASWFKNLVIKTWDETLINSLYEIILLNIKQTQIQINNEQKIKIERTIKKIKNEEENIDDELDDDLLEFKLNTIS